MIYEAQGKTIDLTQLTRLYPAATVDVQGEVAQVSLEWAEMKKKQEVPIASYVLVFDIDPLGEVPNNRIELEYETKEALIEAMNDVAQYL
ncbi:MAG TPA: hypothetical protein ENK65_02700 [Helicobacteraceae bacterium]|nr:hypothetical protein [Helicobacteraceae bacterium]